MFSPKRLHPRSLEALFPCPRTVPKAAVRLCPNGHRQVPTWNRSSLCARCAEAEAEALRALDGRAEKERWRQLLGRPPVVMEILVVQTGRVMRFSPGPARRGPRPRRRI